MNEPRSADALVERLFNATLGALELYSIHVGLRLGLYEALAGSDPMTSDELATTASIAPRYAREWCEQQAVAGFLDVEGETEETRRFRLDAEYAPVFTNPDDPSHVVPFAPMIAGIGQTLPRVVDAYRTGTGVDYVHYGADFRDGQGGINRPAFTTEMGGWLRSSTEIARRLEGDPPARVADVGCGQGFSTLAIARAFPRAQVEGLDIDEPSIGDATRMAAETGLNERVSFAVRDVTANEDAGSYDLVTIFEAVHDMSRPVEVLASLRGMLAPQGSLLIADERVADEFTAP
ncbi:MAG TPA: class I SAM-dependent methyltransferase, partial [Actinomycetota bacterium]